MSLTTDQARTLAGSGGNVVSTDGGKIGGIGQIYLDDSTGDPTWVTAKTGLFGTSESFVPLSEARIELLLDAPLFGTAAELDLELCVAVTGLGIRPSASAPPARQQRLEWP